MNAPKTFISLRSEMLDQVSQMNAKVTGIVADLNTRMDIITSTIESALTRQEPVPAQRGGPDVKVSRMSLDMPTLSTPIALSPTIHVLYSIFRSKVKAKNPDAELASMSEWVNHCVEWWCKKHGFSLGVTTFDRESIDLIGGD